MNGPLRPSMSTISQQQNLLSNHFIQNAVPLGAQQSLSQTSLAMPQNITTNPPMGMLGAAQVPGGPVQRYPIQPNPMQQQQQRQMVPRQPQNPPQLNPAVPNSSANAHIQSQLQGLPFPSNMMQQSMATNPNIRRVHSQPHINNMNPLGVIPGSVAGSMSMGINPQSGIPGQLRQVPGGQQNPQQLNQLRLQHQQQQQPMLPQPTMSDILRSQVAGNPPIQPRMSSAQSQVMSSLTPGPLGSAPLPGGMPGTHPSTFSNGPMPPSQLPTPPRPNSTQGMTMSTPGPSHASISRMRTSPDNANSMSFMNYPPTQFSANNPGRGVPPSPSPSYPYVTSTSPPMQLSDISQTSPPGMMATQGGTPANKFFPTPAQQQLDMSVDMYNQNFAMPPPPSIPSQTPSLQHPSLPSAPHNPSMPNPQQRPPTQPSPGPPHQHPSHRHQHPHQLQTEPMNLPSQAAAPSQQQRQQGSQAAGVSGTPGSIPPSASQPSRGSMSASAFSEGLTAAGRLPPSHHQTHGPPLHPQPPQQQQPLTPIAPRPPGGGTGPALPLPPPPQGSVVGGPQPVTTSIAAQSRPPVSTTPTAIVTTSPPPAGAGADQTGEQGRSIPSRSSSSPSNSMQDKVGNGQGIMRVLQFSGLLSGENRQKHELSFWNYVVKEYFTPKALMKLTLWKDNQKNEAKPFEIGVPILPRFFLVTTQSGVKSMTFSLDGARERSQTAGRAIVECVNAAWTYKYTNGYTITLRGPLTAHVVATSRSPPGNSKEPEVVLRFDEFQFDANYYDKSIALESVLGSRSIESIPMPAPPMMLTAPSPSAAGVGPAALNLSAQQQAEEERRWEEPRTLIEHASIPGEPVNAFGIPQATMRCLELAESVTSMSELIQFAKKTPLGPRDALREFAQKLRESGALLPAPPAPQPPGPHGHPMNPNPQFYPQTPSSSSTTTLYSSVSPSATHSVPPGSTMNSPPNTTPSVMNSPDKQPKAIPQQQQQQGQPMPTAPTTSPGMASASTPSNANSSLKRKQTGDVSSPTMGNDQPTTKRQNRKRGRTGTGPG